MWFSHGPVHKSLETLFHPFPLFEEGGGSSKTPSGCLKLQIVQNIETFPAHTDIPENMFNE